MMHLGQLFSSIAQSQFVNRLINTRDNRQQSNNSSFHGTNNLCQTQRRAIVLTKSSNLTIRATLLAKFRRGLAALFIFALLTSSTPAFAAPMIAGSVRESVQDVRFAFLSSTWANSFEKWWRDDRAVVVNEQIQDQTISRIEISPGSATIHAGEKLFLIAVAYNDGGNTVSNVSFEWKSERRNNGIDMSQAQKLSDGRFDAVASGTFVVTAESGGQQASATITVLSDKARRAAAAQASAANTAVREVSSKSNRSIHIEQAADNTETDKKAQPSGQNNSPVMTNRLPADAEPDEGGWNGGNWSSFDDPGNQTGDPIGRPIDDGAGNSNFQLSAPVVSLPGRGIDLALNLNYNSRLWNKAGNQLTYDIDRGFPAPGWSLGFGKIVYSGSSSGCLVEDADGTKHSFAGKISSSTYTGGWNANFSGYTTDGTLIDYNCSVSSYNGSTSGQASAKLPNGTTIWYGAPSAEGFEMFPTEITDANGNYITIAYRGGRGPQIETIRDTLGRNIQFHYSNGNRLYRVSTAGVGGVERTLIMFHYRQIGINAAFAGGIQPIVRDAYPFVLDAIVYPGTNTGYWFGDADSYSSYGMLAKVQEQRNIWMDGALGDANNPWGVHTGQMTKQAVYNYPLTPVGGLTDAPSFTEQTASWAEMTSDPAKTTYAVYNNANPRRVEVTQPDGTKSVQYSYNAPNQWNDGLIYQDETYAPAAAGGALLAKSWVEWGQGAYNSAVPTRTWTSDERGRTMHTDYDYTGGQFNQVTTACQYGYAGQQLQCESTAYENRPEYVGSRTETASASLHNGRHIFNLVKAKELWEGGVRASRVEYEYDNNFNAGADNHNLINTPGVVMHDHRYNRYTTQTRTTQTCLRYRTGCDYTTCPPQLPSYYCAHYLEQQRYICCDQFEEVSVYEAWTSYRGNVTKTRTYTDAANLTGAIDNYAQYDVTGNLVKQNTDCCQEMSFVYDAAFAYAYPTAQTRGSADVNSPARQTSYRWYDWSTGLPTWSKDYNNLESSVQYNPDTLRTQRTTAPTGAYTHYFYDDANLNVITHVYESNNALVSQNVQFLNGLGQVRLVQAGGASGAWENAVRTEYDSMGRLARQSRPFRWNVETPVWSSNTYDALGRVTKTTAPDGSTAEAFYNETQRPDSASGAAGQTLRSRDAWGRERWARYDERERLAEVVEPNPNGDGSVLSGGTIATQYIYNTLGNLVETVQGAQHRYFAYDSLGRLIRQKLAEQTATLNDAGEYVGAGARWSEAFWYDDRSNLTQRTDARGVKTTYTYNNDPLNRLQWIGYDTNGPRDTSRPILWSPVVSFEYATSGDRERAVRIKAHGVSTETFSYDGHSRISDDTIVMDARPDHPLTTSYLYDSLDRTTEVRYPAEYGQPGSPRKTVRPSFEANTGRLSALFYDNQQQAGNFVYNASEQVTSMKVGTGC